MRNSFLPVSHFRQVQIHQREETCLETRLTYKRWSNYTAALPQTSNRMAVELKN